MIAISGSNMISIVISATITMLMPAALNLEGYAHWQLFSLYSSFAGFFVLGFNDGVFQNYSDKTLDDEFASRLARLKWVVAVLGFVGFTMVGTSMLAFPTDKRFAVGATAVCILFFGTNGFLTYANQIGARFGVVASSILVERLALFLSTITLFLLGCTDYRAFVIASVGGSLLKLAFLVGKTPSVSLRLGSSVDLVVEIRKNLGAGFPVMLAILLGGSILIPSRLVVESTMGASSFALYSFALTTVLLTGTVLSSVAQSAFPLMRKMDSERFQDSIDRAHLGLTLSASVLMLTYFAASVLVRAAYPKFNDSLEFLGLLFPLFIFQSKYLILLTTILRNGGQVMRLLVTAATGVALNLVVALSLALTTQSLKAVALGTLAAYIAWVSAWWVLTRRSTGRAWTGCDTGELAITAWFLIALAAPHVARPSGMDPLAVSFVWYMAPLLLASLWKRRWIRQVLRRVFS